MPATWPPHRANVRDWDLAARPAFHASTRVLHRGQPLPAFSLAALPLPDPPWSYCCDSNGSSWKHRTMRWYDARSVRWGAAAGVSLGDPFG
jgi:hypothetical protein